ncbi:MAG: uracil-DNA glycosylase [Alphaproteobacteria bacterium]
MNCAASQKEILTALEWYVDHGVDITVLDEVQDRSVLPEPVLESLTPTPSDRQAGFAPAGGAVSGEAPAFLGKSDAYDEAVKLAKAVSSLDELQKTIAEFDGVSLKKTASNMVFSDGNPQADIMIIGEAPGADEDRMGKPFVGVSGQLLDRILNCIGLDRKGEEASDSVYISNILNWRPPGNRTPSPAEIEVSLPFIERHIQLVDPKMIILCGGVSAKSLLGSTQSISRLRKVWHDYRPQTEQLGGQDKVIPTLATYHPSYLLRTPLQKKAVWEDMLRVQEKRSDLK